MINPPEGKEPSGVSPRADTDVTELPGESESESESPGSDTSSRRESDASSSSEREPRLLLQFGLLRVGFGRHHAMVERFGWATRGHKRGRWTENRYIMYAQLCRPTRGRKMPDALPVLRPANHESVNLPDCSILKGEPESTRF